MAEVSIAEIMVNIEEMISAHYTEYAEKFEENRDFWLDMAAQELDHAEWIRELYEKSKTGKVIFHEQRFNKQSLQEMQGRLELMLETFLGQTQTMKDAVSSSLSIESFMLEKNYFDVFESDAPELQALLSRLEGETRLHRDTMKEKLEALK